MADAEMSSDEYLETLEPREQLLVYMGRVDSLTDIVDIIGEQAEDLDDDGRAVLGDLLEEVRSLVKDALHQRERLTRALQREAAR
jgi:hypothetical protein